MDVGLIGFVYGAVSKLENSQSILDNPIQTSLSLSINGSIYSMAALGVSSLIPEKFHNIFSGILVFSTTYKITKMIHKRNKII